MNADVSVLNAALSGVKAKDSKPEPLTEEQKDSQWNRWLKIAIGAFVCVTLWMQLATLFVMLFFQGFKLKGFYLNDWTIGVLSNGMLVETYFLARFIVEHLYPKKDSKKD